MEMYHINGGHMCSPDSGTGYSIRVNDGIIDGIAVGNTYAGGGYNIDSTKSIFKHIIPLIRQDNTLGGAYEFLEATLTHWILKENK